MTILSIGFDGSVTEPQLAKWTSYLGRRPGVATTNAWVVSTVVGPDRTVRVATGVGFGDAVHDTSDTDVDVQLAPIASGTRWDTIVARRDWTPPGGTTVFTAVTGVTTQQIAAGILSNPGVTSDQPLALVQVTAGQTTPTDVLDLRLDKDGRAYNVLAASLMVTSLADTGWSALPLVAGWARESWSVTPGYRRFHGQTELRGQCGPSVGLISGLVTFGTLPVGFRPFSFVELAAATTHNNSSPTSVARIEVSPGGVIQAAVSNASPRAWISLDSIRYEARA